MFINNLTQIIKGEFLEDKYYMCDIKTAKTLVLNGFLPISINKHNYVFYKNELLMEFLQEGELK